MCSTKRLRINPDQELFTCRKHKINGSFTSQFKCIFINYLETVISNLKYDIGNNFTAKRLVKCAFDIANVFN